MRYLQVLLFTIVWGIAQAETPVDTLNPQKMVQQLATETLEQIQQNPELLSENSSGLRTILEHDLLPYIHYHYAAYKVMGPAIKQTTKAQRDQFSEAFKEYMLGTFTLLFKQYDPERHSLKFDPVRIKGQVPARFVSPGKPDISLIFYLRQNSQTKEWKVWDLAAEGISQVETKLKEFRPLIRRHGIEYVTSQLQEKVKKGLDSEDISGLPKHERAL